MRRLQSHKALRFSEKQTRNPLAAIASAKVIHCGAWDGFAGAL
ncbi:MAG: hypothetical protein PHV34_08505 [Verrucomicrobiae bacterium]|nr:hypothetical protein [Verrucomicrobiae bacterium]